MLSISATAGFTLPGMILEPGCSAASSISFNPVCGPEFIKRKSFAIFDSSTARHDKAADSVMKSPRLCCSATRCFDSFSGKRVISRSFSSASGAYSRELFVPVPTAVPPSGTSRSCSSTEARRSVARRAFCAYARNSSPSFIGTASCKCVRADLSIPANSSAFFAKDVSSFRRTSTSNREPHRRRHHIIGRLALVDVIVWIDDFVFTTCAPDHLERAVRDDFVHIHVVGRAGACLKYVECEVVPPLSFNQFFCRLNDGVCNRLVELAELEMRACSRFLDLGERRDQ